MRALGCLKWCDEGIFDLKSHESDVCFTVDAKVRSGSITIQFCARNRKVNFHKSDKQFVSYIILLRYIEKETY